MISSLSKLDIQIVEIESADKNMQQLLAQFDAAETQMVSVIQNLEGDNGGHALFLLNEDISTLLIREILHEKARLRELTEMEEEALSEIGNIIINSCLSNYSQIAKGEVGSQLPLLSRGHITQLLQTYEDEMGQKDLFYIHLNINTGSQSYNSYLLWTRLPWLAQL